MSEPYFSPILRTLALDAQFGSPSRVDSSADSLFGDLLRRAEQTHREPQASTDKQPGPKPTANRDRESGNANDSSHSTRDAAEAKESSNTAQAAKNNDESRSDESQGSEESDRQAGDSAAADVVVVTPLATAVDAVDLSLIEGANGKQDAELLSASQLEAQFESEADANAEAAGGGADSEELALGEIEIKDSGDSGSVENQTLESATQNAAEVAAATEDDSHGAIEDGDTGRQQIATDGTGRRLESGGSDSERDDGRETRTENPSIDKEQAADSSNRRDTSGHEAGRADASSQPAEFSGEESSDERPDTRPTNPVTPPNSAIRSGPTAFGPTISAAASQPTEPIVDPARFVSRVARAFEVANQRGEPIQLRLHPPELGSVRLEINVKDGVVTARFETDTASARSALLDNLPALRERLSDQDMRIDRFDVDVRQETNEQPQRFDGDASDTGDEPTDQRDRDPQSATGELSASHSGATNDEDQGTQLNVVA